MTDWYPANSDGRLRYTPEPMEYRCPECYGECDALYIWKDSGAAVECNRRISTHYTDDEGSEDFVCPNGCRLNPEYSEVVYTWRGSGEAVGCQHCISECEPYDVLEMY